MKKSIWIIVGIGLIMGGFTLGRNLSAESFPTPLYREIYSNLTYQYCFDMGRSYQVGRTDAIYEKKLNFDSFLRFGTFLELYRNYPELLKEFERAYEAGFLDASRKP